MEEINQYPKGTDLLWLATYRLDPDIGRDDGFSAKLGGTLEDAAEQAQEIARTQNAILQCLKRRY